MKTVLASFVLIAAIGLGVRAQETQPAPRFGFVDVFIDSGTHPLAAYQFQLKATRGDVKIVGIEGGEHPEFREPPYYDPAAMSQDRVILAAFSTAADLPTHHTRMARIHVMLTGDATPEYDITVDVAASPDAEPIPVTVTPVQGEAE